MDMAFPKQIQAKQTIFYQGEVPARSFRIVSGLVRAYIIHDSGEEATIAFFGPGDIFPVATAYDVLPVALFYYEAFSSCELEVASPEESSADFPRLARRYVGALLHISALAQDTATGKVAYTLRYLAVKFGEKLPDGRHYKISIRLTQQDIAKLCNISRETTSLELTKLKKLLLIRERNKHYVVNLAKLSAEVGEPHACELNLG